jgi:hypothetical protein
MQGAVTLQQGVRILLHHGCMKCSLSAVQPNHAHLKGATPVPGPM